MGRGRHTFLRAKTNFNNNLILFLLLQYNQPFTGPNPPANIEVIEPNDKCCISLNITEGLGRTESFHVYVNDTQQFTTCKVSNDEYTICKISNLMAGSLYQIKVAAFSNDLESVKKSISAVTSKYKLC